jgi:hypothetical protein
MRVALDFTPHRLTRGLQAVRHTQTHLACGLLRLLELNGFTELEQT